jgi:TolA-binding protein
MKKLLAGRAGVRQHRKHRSRPTPKWLLSSELDTTARSRCLMVLSVLSGETPVTEAIVEAKISRNTYYTLETRALQAMLKAMRPRARRRLSQSTELSAASERIAQLQRRVERLEQEKRRLQRLLLLTRKSMEPVVKPRVRQVKLGSALGPSCFTRSTPSQRPSDAPSSTLPGAPLP